MKIKILCFCLLFICSGSLEIRATTDIPIETQWQEISAECQEFLKTQPENIEIRFKLAVAYANLGNIRKTMDELEVMRQQESAKKPLDFIKKYQNHYNAEPENTIFLNYLAFANYIAKQYKQSKIYFEKIIELNPNHTMAYNFLALVHGSLSEYEAALKRVEQARKIQENQFSQLVLGMIYYQQGNMLKAMWHLARSGKLGVDLITR